MLTLDHIAIATETLDIGAAEVATRLAHPLAPGGQHAAMGTWNRLFSLGGQEYAEVIAVEPGAPAPDQPRWFDLDRFAGTTRATAWICRCDNLDAALAAAPAGTGAIWPLARGDLRWRMAIPTDGRLPFGGLFPALIEWGGDAHPAPRLPDQGTRLTALHLHSPQADALRAALAPLISDPRITIHAADNPRLSATLTTAAGAEVTL